MQIGICTSDFATQPVETLFARIAAYGFTQVQLSFASIGEEEMPAAIGRDLVRRIRSALREYGLELVAINATFNMIHPDLTERDRGVKRFPLLACVAGLLDCKVLTLCTGTCNEQDMWRYHPENETEQSWRNMTAVMEDLLLVAEQNDLFLGVETEAANVVSSPERARRLLDEMQSPRLKIIMDCANLFPAGTARPDQVRPTIGKAFDLLGEDIILAHGKDIEAGDGIVFTSPGRGIIDYPFFLERLQAFRFTGGMLLHGIRQEQEIPACFAFMQDMVREAASG